MLFCFFFFSSRRRHTRCALVTGVQTCALPILDPALAVVLVGSDPASEVYVGRKIAECNKAGIRSIEHRLQADADEAELLTLIDSLNADPSVHEIGRASCRERVCQSV